MGFKNNSFSDEEIQSRSNNYDSFFDKFNKKLAKKTTTMDLLPYKKMTDNNQFVNTSDQLEEFYLIRGKALKNTSTQEGMGLINDFRRFAKTYIDDVKIFVSMYPTETFEQQRYFIFKSRKIKAEIDNLESIIGRYQSKNDMARVKDIQHRINQLRLQDHYIKTIYLSNEEYAADNLKNQEYLMVIYGESAKDIQNKVDNIQRWSGNALELVPISPDKKINKIASFLNPTKFLSNINNK